MDILIYYVIPNVVLFSSLYAIGKYVESSSAYFIENYEESQQKLVDFADRFK